MITPTFITDRTYDDLVRLMELTDKVKNGTATITEIAEYEENSKGAFNADDLNRYGNIMLLFAEEMPTIALPNEVKTDWQNSDNVTAQLINAMLGNIAYLRNLNGMPSIVPTAPSAITDYNTVNDIERILEATYRLIQITQEGFNYTGDTISNDWR